MTYTSGIGGVVDASKDLLRLLVETDHVRFFSNVGDDDQSLDLAALAGGNGPDLDFGLGQRSLGSAGQDDARYAARCEGERRGFADTLAYRSGIVSALVGFDGL